MSEPVSAADGIRVTVAEGVAELRLCADDSRNALSAAMWKELRRFAKSVARDRAVRVILLAGDDTVFSSGADIREFAALRAPGATRAYDDLVESALRALEAVPQPTVACIAGPCVGAGASLACSCDLRVAADDAYFMVPAARLGLGYDPRGIARFVRVFGDSAVRGLLLGGQRYQARTAHSQGAVHLLVEPGTVLAEGRSLAGGMARNAPLTVAAAKGALAALAGGDHDDERVRRLALEADASADYAEGLAAFQEKRKPEFRGR
ncbi:MAG: enoyl-CoA hydratase/isomerase family protein [Deltaproteobacteria bacterium]|nr:enoyl-CoA hydratase/isomerase family protein [Deltaproteobacteria bacterium]